MNTKNRLQRLEKRSGTGEKMRYTCFSKSGDTEYKASPFVGDGETFTFKTEEAMTAYFDAHKEYEFLHVQIVRASEAIKRGDE